jgi:hypothetical protein
MNKISESRDWSSLCCFFIACHIAPTLNGSLDQQHKNQLWSLEKRQFSRLLVPCQTPSLEGRHRTAVLVRNHFLQNVAHCMWLHRFFGIDQERVAFYDGNDEPSGAITAVINYGTSTLYHGVRYICTIKLISIVPSYVAFPLCRIDEIYSELS